MGTNFYWIDSTFKNEDEDDELDVFEDEYRRHIGKRSAAGLYCWDCKVTLCPGGEERIHYGDGTAHWHKTCPKCGAPPVQEKLGDPEPISVELGFARPKEERPEGVRGAASFSWAQDPAKVRMRCETAGDDVIIEDEYGRKMSGLEFLRMLQANCPIEFTHHVGVRFS